MSEVEAMLEEMKKLFLAQQQDIRMLMTLLEESVEREKALLREWQADFEKFKHIIAVLQGDEQPVHIN